MENLDNKSVINKRFLKNSKSINLKNFDKKSKKLVFVNDKNWNIVTTMISGIYKSIVITANDKYTIPSKIDFKIHNKLEIEAVFSTAFNKCKFKDYAPHVF
jgi:hypothetical protein